MNLLRATAFRRMYIAHLVSQFGSGVTLIALPLVALNTLAASEFQIGLLAAVGSLPILLFGLLAGVLADRRPRRPLMIAMDFARFLALLTIPLAAWSGRLRFEWLLVVALLVGTFSIVFDVAAQSWLAGFLTRDQLVPGNSLMQFGFSLGEVVGPGLAGVLIQWLTAPVAIVADALSFLVSGLFLQSIDTPEPIPPPTRRSLGADLREGLACVVDTPILRALGIAILFWNLGNSAALAMMVVFLGQTLGLGASGIGLVFAAGSFGLLIGSIFPARVARRLGLGRAILAGVAFALPGLVLRALATGEPWQAGAMTALGLFGYGLGGQIFNVNQFSLRQAVTPMHLQGRAAAVLRVIIRGAWPLGSLFGGVLATLAGPRSVMWFSLLGPPLAFVVIWRSPIRNLRVMPTRDDPPA